MIPNRPTWGNKPTARVTKKETGTGAHAASIGMVAWAEQGSMTTGAWSPVATSHMGVTKQDSLGPRGGGGGFARTLSDVPGLTLTLQTRHDNNVLVQYKPQGSITSHRSRTRYISYIKLYLYIHILLERRHSSNATLNFDRVHHHR